MEGEECRYVPSDYRTPDYSVLGREQVAYYLYWRSGLSRGEVLRGDRGYAWMRMCEIVNSRMDPVRGMRELRLIHDNSRLSGIPQSEVSDVMFDYAVANGLDLPRNWYVPVGVRTSMVLSEAMASPTEWLSWAVLRGTSRYSLPDGAPEMDVYALADMALPGIDARLRETTGRGISETYGGGRRSSAYTVFKRFPYFLGDRDYIVEYTEMDIEGDFGEFMTSLCRYCCKAILKSNGLKGPTVPSSFGKDLRAIVDRELANGLVYHMDPPSRTVRGTVRSPVSAKERALLEIGESFGEASPFSENRDPVMLYDRYARRRENPRPPDHDTDGSGSAEPSGPMPYVPSGYANPDFRSFDESQRGFYLHWRGLAREGRYIDTDAGYVWLYLCELANSQSDPGFVKSQLVGLQRAYGGGARDFRLIGRTYLDYCLLHRLEVDDPWMYPSPMTACFAMDAYLSDGKPPDAESMVVLSHMTDDPMARDVDEDSVGIACLALDRIGRILDTRGESIEDICGLKATVEDVVLFSQLAYYPRSGESRTVRVTYPDYYTNAAFWTGLSDVLRNSVRAVHRHRRHRGYSVGECSPFRVPAKGIVTESAEAWFRDREARERADRAMSVRFDASAIEAAESDLREVTGMMSVGSDEEEPAEPEPEAPAPSSGDPWEDMAARIGDAGRRYLLAVLSGSDPDVPPSGRPAVEDAINTAALDTVGDTVLENGTLVEDYREDLERALR